MVWKQKKSYFILYLNVLIKKFLYKLCCNSKKNYCETRALFHCRPRAVHVTFVVPCWVKSALKASSNTGYLDLCNFNTGQNIYIKIIHKPLMYINLDGWYFNVFVKNNVENKMCKFMCEVEHKIIHGTKQILYFIYYIPN